MFEARVSSAVEIERGPEPAGAGINENINADLLLETIVCGLHWSLLHIGTMSILLSACQQTKASWTLRPWRHILDDNSKIMQLALRYGPDIGLAPAVGDELGKLYEQLSALKISTIPLTKSATTYGAAEWQRVGQLAQKWRQLSQSAVQALRGLEPEVSRRLVRQYQDDGRTLVRFLSEAAGGEIGRVTAKGEISLPTLSQRREAPRAKIDRPCRLVWSNQSAAAVLFDASKTGIGIVCDQRIDEGQAVSVELEDGRRLQGTVVRRDGNRKGVSLSRPLASDDPLFKAARSNGTAGPARSR